VPCLKGRRTIGTVAAARIMTSVLMLARQGTYYGDFKGAGACSFQVSCKPQQAPALPVSLAPRSARPAWALSACGMQLPHRRKRTRACPLAACSTRPLSPAPGVRAAQYGDAYARPWSNKLARGVAVNAPQYGGSQPCGMCIAYRGTGKGAGADPVPDAMQYALVTDLCPECAHGALAAHRTRLPLPLYHAVVMREKRGAELVLALWQDPAQLQVLCALVASLAWRAHPARRPVAWQGLARTGCQGAGPGS